MKVLKYSRHRETIKNYLHGRTDHPTADSIYRQIKADHPKMSLGTIYRNLTLLSDQGLLQRIYSPDGSVHFDPNPEQHGHFICTTCHSIRDIELPSEESFSDFYQSKSGDQVASCTICLYGTCRQCMENA